MSKILSNYSVNMKELQKAPSKILDEANGRAIAILDKGEACAYLVPSALYEKLIDIMDDFQLSKDVEMALNNKEEPIHVNINKL